MPKYSPTNVPGGFSPTKININLQDISDVLENTLSRDGTGPNQMEADHDLNGHDLLNVNEIGAARARVTGTLDTNQLVVGGNTLVPPEVLEIQNLAIALWNTEQIFNEGDIVRTSSQEYFQATQTSLNQHPTLTSGYWKPLPINDGELVFDTVLSFVTSSKPISGSYIRTRGYHTIGDGGEGTYQVVASTLTPVDGGLCIQLDSGLKALLITGETVSLRQFGAIGNGTSDDTTPVTNAFSSGRSVTIPAGVFKVTGNINVSSNTTISGEGKNVSVIAADADVNGELCINPTNVSNILFKGVTFRGNPLQNGAGNKANSVYVRGCTNVTFENCSFDTFTTHSLTIRRADGVWISGGDENTQTSIDNLIDLCSTNIRVLNCDFDYAGSNHLAVFGGNEVKITGCNFSANTSLTDILIDDASQSTQLEDYAINDNVVIVDCVGTTACRLDGCASGRVSGCTFGSILTRSYDFDQQKLNLDRPFFWFNFLERSIVLTNNQCSHMDIRTGYEVSVSNNTVKSHDDGDNLIVLSNNGTLWGGAYGTVWDNIDTVNRSSLNHVVTNNTLVAVHENITGVVAGSISPQPFANCQNNTGVIRGGSFDNVINPPNSSWRYSYTLGSISQGFNTLYQSDTTSQSKDSGFIVKQSSTPARFQGASFGADYILCANFNDFDGVIDNANYYSCGIKLKPSNGTIEFMTSSATNTVATTRAILDSSGHFYPVSSTTQSLGTASQLWSEVFASTGTINTSDALEKQQIRSLNEREQAVARSLRESVKVYKLNQAVKAKGSFARNHIGFLAQEVEKAFESQGLSPNDYGIVCRDSWEEELDEFGNIVKPAGNSVGLRYDELICFIISVI